MGDAPHTLVLGIGRTGKSTLLRALALAARRAGIDVLVLDVLGGRWPATRVYASPDAFYQDARAARNCVLMIDEAGEAVGHGSVAVERQWIATRKRHDGCQLVLGGHRATQLHPTIRSQCTRLYCFRQALDDARALASQFAEPRLLEVAALPRHEFIALDTCETPVKQKLSKSMVDELTRMGCI